MITSVASMKRAAAIVVCEDEKIIRRTAAELQAAFGKSFTI